MFSSIEPPSADSELSRRFIPPLANIGSTTIIEGSLYPLMWIECMQVPYTVSNLRFDNGDL